MASVLHSSARTTPHLRAEFQASKESSRALAARYGLNAKTVRKWRKRTTTGDALMGPKKPKNTVLTPAEEAIVCQEPSWLGLIDSWCKRRRVRGSR
jgi:transposase-like protein